MPTYTKQELLEAISDEMDMDEEFREQIEEAVIKKKKSWLISTIEEIAQRIWGVISDGFIGWCLRKLFGLF